MTTPKYAIGSTVSINGTDYQVVKYHRVNKKVEVMFRSTKDGSHVSLPLTTLETHDLNELK